MLPDGSTPRADIALSLVLIVVCSAILWATREIPPGTFEPLGSAPVPQATAGLIILLSLAVMGRALWALARGTLAEPADPGFAPRPLDAAITFALTVGYVFVLQLKVVPFAYLTSVFLFVTIGFLIRFDRRLLTIAAGVALIMGFGCEYVFTRIFVVDLPAS